MDGQGGVHPVPDASQPHVHEHDRGAMFLGQADRLVRRRGGGAHRPPHGLDIDAQQFGDKELVIDNKNAVLQVDHDSTGGATRISVRAPRSFPMMIVPCN